MSSLLVLASVDAFAQSSAVSGKVVSPDGPLQHVSVTVEGKNEGVITNELGEFTIQAVKGQRLTFSHVGYNSQTITLTASQVNLNSIYVTLEPDDNSQLEEIVVVGFGSQKKTNLTGSVATVDAKQLENRPVRSAAQALQGLAPGLNISQNSGSLGSSPSINIRGNGTIGTSSSSPLILIDGSEGSLTALNPQDIESVSVLKDAGAASIYGSRAAFGVILIKKKNQSWLFEKR